jgi:glutamine---fructose-6-phosphate transaminase (isomerizing)
MLTQAVCDALREVIGTYGLAVISADQPDTIVGARRGSPLIIGIGSGEIFWPATPTPSSRTRKRSFISTTTTWRPSRRTFRRIESRHGHRQRADQQPGIFSQEDAVRGKHAHFMLKEIFEQPQTVRTPCAAAWILKARPPNSAA